MTKKKPKAPNKLSKKTLLLLFEEGKGPNDPEVKELGYRASSVRNYYSKWQSGKGEVSKAGNKLETPLPKSESMGGVAETAKFKPSPVSEALFIVCKVTIQASVQ